jgi:NTE family protein
MEEHAKRGPVIALVLGSGWKLGVSFHAGVLLALRDVWGVDARSVDSVTGTSAGALTAGFVGAGLGPGDIFGRETCAELSDPARDLMARIDTIRGSGATVAGDAAAVPRTVARFFDDLTDATWLSRLKLRLCAVDACNGRLATLDAVSGATPGGAIAASCSVPGLARPVRIGDRSYVGGAVRSVNNAGTVATTVPDIVVVSAPMSVDRPLFPRNPMALVRNSVPVQTARECQRLATTCRVVSIEPSKSDVAPMGASLNAGARREHVARFAYATAGEILHHARSAEVLKHP